MGQKQINSVLGRSSGESEFSQIENQANLGKCALDAEDFAKAQEYFQQALKLARKYQRSRQEVQFLIHLATAEAAQAQPQKALKSLKNALDASEHPLNQSYRELILHRMGVLLAQMNLQDEARQCLERALKLHRLSGNFKLTISTQRALQALKP